MTTQEEHDADCRAAGFPYCDTCNHAAVVSEFLGWMHSTPEHHFGDQQAFNDHEVTTRKWAHERYGDPL